MELGLSLSLMSIKEMGFVMNISSGYDLYIPSWDSLYPIDPDSNIRLHSANGLEFVAADESYVELDNAITLSGDFRIDTYAIKGVGDFYILGKSNTSGNWFRMTNNLRISIGSNVIAFNYSDFTGFHISIRREVDVLNLYIDNVFIESQPDTSGGADIVFDVISRRKSVSYNGELQYLYLDADNLIQPSEYNFASGVGTRLYDSRGGNHGTLKTDNVDPLLLPTWLQGLNTPFNLLTAPESLGYNVYPVFNDLDTEYIINGDIGIDLTGNDVTWSFILEQNGDKQQAYANGGAFGGLSIGVDDIEGYLCCSVKDSTGTRLNSNLDYASAGVTYGDKIDVVVTNVDYNARPTVTFNGITANDTTIRINPDQTKFRIGSRDGTFNFFKGVIFGGNDGVNSYSPFNNYNGNPSVGTFGTQGSNETEVGSGIDGFNESIRGFNRYTDSTGTTPDPNGSYIAYETCE